jgi:TP901 family phage tail tape measure protein
MSDMNLGSVFATLELRDSKFTSGLNRATRTLTKTVQTMERHAKRAAIAAGAVAVASTKAFADFEEQMANVSTMLSDQSTKYLPLYSNAIRDMSVEFGESTSTLSQGLYNVLSASIDAGDAIGVLETSVKAAKAGMTDTSTATYAITGILNAYGVQADRAGQVSDVLFSTVKSGQTTFRELAPVVGRVTAISSEAGVSFEQVSAALSTITRGGIATDEAVTGLRQALIALQGQHKEAVQIAAAYGVELSASSLAAEGLAGMLDKLSTLSDETLKDIFSEVRARTALTVLMKDQEGFLRDYEQALNSAGMTERAFSKMTKTLAHHLRQLWQVIKQVSVGIGSKFADDIKRLTKYIVEHAEQIIAWAEDATQGLVDFIRFMREDWRAGVEIGLNATLELFKGFGESLLIILEDVFSTAFSNVGVWIKNSLARQKVFDDFYKQALEAVGSKGGILAMYGDKWWQSGGEGAREREIALREQARKMAEEATTFVVSESVKFNKRTADFLGDATTNRLKAIAEKTQANVKELFAQIKVGAGESASEFDQILQQADEWLNSTNLLVGESRRHSEILGREREIVTDINSELEKRIGQQEELNRLQQIRIELAMREQNIIAGFTSAYDQIRTNRLTLGGVGVGMAQSINQEWVTAFQNMATEGQRWSDSMQNFFRQVGVAFMNMMARMAAESIMYQAIMPVFANLANIIHPTGQVFTGNAPANFTNPSGIVEAPAMAAGGIVHRPMLAFVGEKQPEAVIPLDQLKNSEQPITFHVHNFGLPVQITRQQEYMSSDGRIVDVVLNAMDNDPRVRRGVKSASKR